MTNKKIEYIADKIINLYVDGRVSEDVMNNFLNYLASDYHSKQKNEALMRVWDAIESSADSSTYRSLEEIRSDLNMIKTSEHTRREGPRPLTPGRIVLRVAAVVIPVLFLALLGVHRYGPLSSARDEAMVAVPVLAGKQIIDLPDGSTVWLRAGSELIYNKDPKIFNRNREVELHGEAFFKIEKNRRPFYVRTDHVTTKVLGTEFDVRAYDDDKMTFVMLESRKVEMEMDDRVLNIVSGEKFAHSNTTGERRVSPASSNVSRWRNIGELIIDNETLTEIFAECKEHFGVKVKVVVNKLEKLDDQRYTIRFSGDAPIIEEVLGIMQNIRQFIYIIDNDE